MCAHLQLASQLLAAAVPVQCPELRLFAKGSLDVDASAHSPISHTQLLGYGS